jgi:hypothetical protein
LQHALSFWRVFVLTDAQPPHGYDCVIGEPGGELKYDEAIVYTVRNRIPGNDWHPLTHIENDEIRPPFLIIYTSED